MIHKIGKLKDVDLLPPMTPSIKRLILEKVKLLSAVYGEGRDIDNDDGGIILYSPCGTSKGELRRQFDYTSASPEFVEVNDGICHALYLTNNEYSVSIILHEEDLPNEIKKEID